jgi:uncharacterized membrane protein (DUF485 family)
MNPPKRRADIDEATRAKVRRSAWSLALLAVVFYLTFIVWNAYRAAQGI